MPLAGEFLFRMCDSEPSRYFWRHVLFFSSLSTLLRGVFHSVTRPLRNHLRGICAFHQRITLSKFAEYLFEHRSQSNILRDGSNHFTLTGLHSCLVLLRLYQPVWHSARLQVVFIRLIRKKSSFPQGKNKGFFLLFTSQAKTDVEWGRNSTDTYLERSHLALMGRVTCCQGVTPARIILHLLPDSTHETSALPLLQDASDVSLNILGYPRFWPHVPAVLSVLLSHFWQIRSSQHNAPPPKKKIVTLIE